MQWRQWVGLKPTQADLAQELLRAADKSAVPGWQYDAADSSLRSGEHIINLVNIYREYSMAPRSTRPALLQKYAAMVRPSDQVKVAGLWMLARTRIFPILRSRHERVAIEIQHRREQKPFPPRAARPFMGHLDIVIGYDHGQTVSQVTAETATEWGVPLEAVIDRARDNLRALPAPYWESVGNSVWKLESAEGYNESFLQLPNIFEQLPAKGSRLAMIPNRGVLLATGSEEPAGLTALLAEARNSIQQAPWPLSGDLFRITPHGVELYVPEGNDGQSLATLQKIDISSVYDAQKTALQAHHEAIGDDVYVASYGLLGQKDNPQNLQSWCSWTEGVPSLLPTTDLVAFVWDLKGAKKTALVRWAGAQRLVGHYFKPTNEDPPRTRVDIFPSPDELIELQKVAI
jgi:hypothetical protein